MTGKHHNAVLHIKQPYTNSRHFRPGPLIESNTPSCLRFVRSCFRSFTFNQKRFCFFCVIFPKLPYQLSSNPFSSKLRRHSQIIQQNNRFSFRPIQKCVCHRYSIFAGTKHIVFASAHHIDNGIQAFQFTGREITRHLFFIENARLHFIQNRKSQHASPSADA